MRDPRLRNWMQNAALVLLLSLLLIRRMKLPITGAALACLFLMAGFALLGKNLLNITPIVIGGWLHALYKRESFARYVYLILYGTCLSPMVSFLLVRVRPGFRWLAMSLCGLVIGFLLPAIARYTTRVHQGYNLYNVGFAAGILGLGLASFFKGFGVEFTSHDSWSREGHLLLCGLMTALLGGLLLGIIEIFASAYLSSELSLAIVFGVLIVVLLVKPSGLLGRYVPEKV